MRTENYSWRKHTQSCQIAVYVTDPSKTPPQWQEMVKPGDDRYDQLSEQLAAESIEATATGQYSQYTINSTDRIYMRTSLMSGNSWEVKLDENGRELPDPCAVAQLDPRDRTYTLANAIVKVRHRRTKNGVTRVVITTEGNLPQA